MFFSLAFMSSRLLLYVKAGNKLVSAGRWRADAVADLLESGRDGDAAAGLQPDAVRVPGRQTAPADRSQTARHRLQGDRQETGQKHAK